ncbi:hypothetical protein CVT91_04715 [Candidatus Atribacteria bacterium HGW-Atribacteria-1]|nr:MAG: hypothetical protein CVT91_04715 [Candidatus Atribacteria bacterium HGW-Atribacteria-1]
MEFNLNKFKERVLTLESIGLLYILIVGCLCHILPIPEMVKAFLALPGLLIIPYLVGKTISILIEKILRIELSLDTVSNFIEYWCIGIISMVIIVYFLNYLLLFYVQSYIILILFLMTPSVFYKKKQEHLKMFIKTYGGHTAILFSLAIGIVGFLFLTYFSPYPYQFGCDYHFHSYVSTNIIEKNIITADSNYLSSFSILVANNIIVFNLYDEPLMFWWIIQFIFYLVYAFGLYLFSYQLSQNKILSLISVIAGIFVISHLFVPIYFYDPAPKSMILMLFPYLLFFVHNLIIQNQKNNVFELKKSVKHILFIAVVFTSLFLLFKNFFFLSFHMNFIDLRPVDTIGIILLIFVILGLLIIKYGFKDIVERKLLFLLSSLMCIMLFFHLPMGIFGCLFILFYFSYSIFIEKYPLVTKYLLYVCVLFTILFFILQEIEVLKFSSVISFTSISVPDSLSLYGFQNMKNLLQTLYSPIVIGLFILGCIYSIFYNKKQHFPLLFLVSAIFIFLFAPIEMIFRLGVFLHPIMAYFVAYGLITTRRILFTNGAHSIYSKYFITSFIVIVLLLSVVENSLNEIDQVVSKKGVLTCSWPYQYDAAYALRHNTPKNTFVLFYWPGSSTSNVICNRANRQYFSNSIIVNSPECVNEIFTAQNSIESYKKIRYLLTTNDSLSCAHYLVGGFSIKQYELRSERYENEIKKMRNSPTVILITNYDLNTLPQGAVNKFYDSLYFTPLYNDTKNQIYIFGVNPEPGVPFKIQNNKN